VKAASALFRTTLAALLLSVAQAHGSALAERAAYAAEGTGELALRLHPEDLPPKTADGRLIPDAHAKQVANVLQHLHDRGQLPAHPDISIRAIKAVAEKSAALDNSGCHATLRYLERETNLDESQIRAVFVYLRDIGMERQFSRVSRLDRQVGGLDEPATHARSTVRVVELLPRRVVDVTKLTEEELLDLIAYGERKAQLVLRLGEPSAPPPPPPRPASPPPPPAPPALPVPPAPALDLRALIAPLDELERNTISVRFDPALAWEVARASGLDLPEAARTLRELATDAAASALAGRRWDVSEATSAYARYAKQVARTRRPQAAPQIPLQLEGDTERTKRFLAEEAAEEERRAREADVAIQRLRAEHDARRRPRPP
jgi:hypothetical protein